MYKAYSNIDKMNPITEDKAKSFLSDNTPRKFSKMAHRTDLNMSFFDFARYTKSLIEEGEWPEVEKCLKEVNLLFTKGEASVRDAIVNVYAYSLGMYLDQNTMIIGNVAGRVPDELKIACKKEFGL